MLNKKSFNLKVSHIQKSLNSSKIVLNAQLDFFFNITNTLCINQLNHLTGFTIVEHEAKLKMLGSDIQSIIMNKKLIS